MAGSCQRSGSVLGRPALVRLLLIRWSRLSRQGLITLVSSSLLFGSSAPLQRLRIAR